MPYTIFTAITYFIIVAIGIFVFKILFHKISVLSLQLCIYHKEEKPLERFLKLFSVFFYLSIPFILVVYSVSSSFSSKLSIFDIALITGAVSFIVLVSSRLMTLNKWSCSIINIKNEKIKIEANMYSLITASLVVSVIIVAYNFLMGPNSLLSSLFLQLPLTLGDTALLTALFLTNVLLMTAASTILTRVLGADDEIKI